MNPIVVTLIGLVLALISLAWAAKITRDQTLIAVVAVMGALAAVWNVIVPIPNVEATTLCVIVGAAVLGSRAGVAIGAVATLGTSVAGGLGVWTPWQIVGFTALALAIGPVASRTRTRSELGVVCGIAAGAYDLAVTAPTVAATMQIPPGLIPGLLIAGLPYTLVHMVASGLTAAAVGPALRAAVERSLRRVDRTARLRT